LTIKKKNLLKKREKCRTKAQEWSKSAEEVKAGGLEGEKKKGGVSIVSSPMGQKKGENKDKSRFGRIALNQWGRLGYQNRGKKGGVVKKRGKTEKKVFPGGIKQAHASPGPEREKRRCPN